jgi:hypothetical protein
MKTAEIAFVADYLRYQPQHLVGTTRGFRRNYCKRLNFTQATDLTPGCSVRPAVTNDMPECKRLWFRVRILNDTFRRQGSGGLEERKAGHCRQSRCRGHRHVHAIAPAAEALPTDKPF